MKRILVTGGTGYIGSHACVALLNQGFAVVVADNLCNSHCDILPRIVCAPLTPPSHAWRHADIVWAMEGLIVGMGQPERAVAL